MTAQYVNVFEYIDYRQFLSDYFTARRAVDKKFTKAEVCRKLGLPNSRSYISDVLRKKLELSKVKMELLIDVLSLSEEEARYFRILVQYNNTCSKSEKEYLFEQLVSLNRTPKKFVAEAEYKYFSKWYHSAIRSLLDMINFKNDYKFLSKKLYPPITPTQARESIKLLKKLKFIGKDQNGFWRPTHKVITTQQYIKDELIKKYQSECLEIGSKILLASPPHFQFMSTETLSISREGFSRIEKRFHQFISELHSIVHKDEHKPECIYQMNFHMFPHSN